VLFRENGFQSAPGYGLIAQAVSGPIRLKDWAGQIPLKSGLNEACRGYRVEVLMQYVPDEELFGLGGHESK